MEMNLAKTLAQMAKWPLAQMKYLITGKRLTIAPPNFVHNFIVALHLWK